MTRIREEEEELQKMNSTAKDRPFGLNWTAFGFGLPFAVGNHCL